VRRSLSKPEPAWWLLLAAACAVASITAMQTALALAGLAWAARRARGRREPFASDPLLMGLLGGLVAWSLLSALASPSPAHCLGATASTLMWVTVPMAATLLTSSRRRLVASLLLLQAAILGVWALVEFFWWWDGDPLARVRGPYSHHMTLAGVLLVCTLQALPRPDLRPLLRGSLSRWAARLAVFLGLGGLAATLTRSAAVGAVAGLATLVVMRAGDGLRRRLAVVAAVTLPLVVAAALGVPWLVERGSAAGLSAAAASVEDRLVLWRAGGRMIRERPLVGIGANRVRRDAQRFLDPGHRRPAPPAHLHSAPLNLAAERGLPALGLAAALYVVTFLRWRRSPGGQTDLEGIRRGSLAAAAAFLVMGLFEDNLGDSEVLFVHLLTLSALWVRPRPDGGDPAGPSAGPPEGEAAPPAPPPAGPDPGAGGRAA
jgi:hypothetical protein